MYEFICTRPNGPSPRDCSYSVQNNAGYKVYNNNIWPSNPVAQLMSHYPLLGFNALVLIYFIKIKDHETEKFQFKSLE